MNIQKEIQKLPFLNVRFAPCPNGPATLGHLKGFLLLDLLCKNFRATNKKANLNLRFDDNNGAEMLLPSYYESFLDLVKLYKIELNEIVYASDRHKDYKLAVKKLIDLKHAYFCECKPISTLEDLKPCECLLNPDIQNSDLDKLLAPRSVKFKSKIGKDYVIYRTIYDEVKKIAYNSPTIALQGPVDDYYQKINLILRGRDLEPLTYRQKEIYQTLYESDYPETHYWGRISIWHSGTKENYEVSKTTLKGSSRTDIPNLEGFYARGYKFEAIKNWLLSYGLTKHDMKIDIVKLNYYQKRELTDPIALETLDFENLETGYYKCYYSLNQKGYTKKRNFYYWNKELALLTEY